MEKTRDFTEGKILPQLLSFAFPVLLALFLQSMYGAVDLLVVGQFSSPIDVSAVSTGSQIMHSITTVITGLAMGITVLVGQRIGEKRPEQAGEVIGNGICLFAVLAVIITVVMVLGSFPGKNSGGGAMWKCVGMTGLRSGGLARRLNDLRQFLNLGHVGVEYRALIHRWALGDGQAQQAQQDAHGLGGQPCFELYRRLGQPLAFRCRRDQGRHEFRQLRGQQRHDLGMAVRGVFVGLDGVLQWADLFAQQRDAACEIVLSASAPFGLGQQRANLVARAGGAGQLKIRQPREVVFRNAYGYGLHDRTHSQARLQTNIVQTHTNVYECNCLLRYKKSAS